MTPDVLAVTPQHQAKQAGPANRPGEASSEWLAAYRAIG